MEDPMTNIIRIAGIAWFRREDYARARKLFEDGNGLPPTFDQWLKQAEKVKQNAEAHGFRVEKVHIDLDTFPAWCAERGLNVNAHARTQFANHVVTLKHAQPH
jgi:hypothetical protein